MTSVLDKFKQQQLDKAALLPDKAEATEPVSTEFTNSEAMNLSKKPQSLIEKKLAELKARTPTIADNLAAQTLVVDGKANTRSKIQEALAKQKTVAVAQEAKQIAKSTEVPDNIFTLDQRVNEIDGLNAAQFSEHLAKTYKALHDDQPELANMLELINKNMRQFEELTYLLTSEQLGLYFDGLMKVTGTQIKTSKPKTNALKNLQQMNKEGGLDLDAL